MAEVSQSVPSIVNIEMVDGRGVPVSAIYCEYRDKEWQRCPSQCHLLWIQRWWWQRCPSQCHLLWEYEMLIGQCVLESIPSIVRIWMLIGHDVPSIQSYLLWEYGGWLAKIAHLLRPIYCRCMDADWLSYPRVHAICYECMDADWLRCPRGIHVSIFLHTNLPTSKCKTSFLSSPVRL